MSTITLDHTVSVLVSGSPVSTSFTVNSNPDRLLDISVATFKPTITSITYGGHALTKVTSAGPGSACRVEKWYLVNPPTGSNSLTITDSSGDFKMVTMTSLYNVYDLVPVNTFSSATGSNNTATATVTTTSANTLLVDALSTIESPTMDGAQTLLGQQAGSNQFNYQHEGASYKALVSAGSGTMTWNLGGSGEWEYIVAAYNLAPTHTTRTISMQISVTQKAKYIAMQLRVKLRLTKTISIKVRVYNPFTPGRLRNLEVRSIDIQKFTKDTAQAQASATLSTNLCNFLAANFNLTHIATVGLIDPPSIYPTNFVISPLTAAQYNQQWCDAIHATGLNIVHRLTSMAMEGSPNFPAWPAVNSLLPGSYTDVVPKTITDNFNRTSIGSNYVINAVSGGFWEISYNRLAILNSGNEFTYNIARTVASYSNYTVTGTVERGSFGEDGMVFHLSNKNTSPFFQGYAIYMTGTNTLTLEDLGQRDITLDTRKILATNTDTTFTVGHNYYIKIVTSNSGSRIKIKIWDVLVGEPGHFQIESLDISYTAGWIGFTTEGFGKIIHFDDLTIVPNQNLNTYIGMVYNWMINNPTSFKDNDIVAPFPEFDTCQDFNTHCYFNPAHSWLHAQFGQNTVNFFNDLKDVEDLAASQIGVRLKTGYTTYNFTSLQSVTDPNKVPNNPNDLDYKDSKGLTMMAKAGSIVVDWYGTTSSSLWNPLGLTHPPQEMYDSLYAVWNKYHIQIFLQEWGGFVPFNINDVSAHDQFYRDTFNKFADLADLHALTKFSYWGAQDTGETDTGLLKRGSNPNWSTASLRIKGQVLQQFYQTGLPASRNISMRIKNSYTPTGKAIQMRIDNPGVNPKGRLAKLLYRSIDVMKWTKDTTTSQPTDKTISNIVTFLRNNFNLTHFAVCLPIDPLSFYPNTYIPAPRTIVGEYQKWVDNARSNNLNILHRPVSFGMEGDAGFTWLVDINRFPAGTTASAPTDGNTTWLGIVYKFIIDNPNLFTNGDIWAPFPERTQGLFDQPPGIHSFLPVTGPGLQQNYVDFFIGVKAVSDAAFAVIGKTIHTGFSGDNYSEVRSGWINQSLYDNNRIVSFDYYQNYNGDGYGAPALSEDLDAVYYAHGRYPLFWQEWGTTPDMIRATNSARDSIPPGGNIMYGGDGIPHTLAYWGLTAHPENRAPFFTWVLDVVSDAFEAGKLIGFNYWGFWDTGVNDSGLLQLAGTADNINNFSLRPEGILLQKYLNDGSLPPPSYFTRGISSSILTNKNDLSTIYSPTEISNVSINDGTGVQIEGTPATYLIHQYKLRNSNNKDTINIIIDVQSTINPSIQPIYLQIWNTRTKLWETLAVNDSNSLGVDYQLNGIVTQNLTDYYDNPNYSYFNVIYNINEITIRVYQRNI